MNKFIIMCMIMLVSLTVVYAFVPANNVVISELRGDSRISERGKLFIELYNPTNAIANISSWSIISNFKTPSLNIIIPPGSSIKPNSYYLIGDSGGSWPSGWSKPDRLTSFVLPNSDYAIKLVNKTGNVVDAVGWGTLIGVSADYYETTPLNNFIQGHSYERKPGYQKANCGNWQDTNNNSNDFLDLSIPNPQNSSSSFTEIPCDTDTTPPGPISSLHLINRTNQSLAWGWTNPTDPDFYQAIIYLDGVNRFNQSLNSINFNNLQSNRSYTITIQTKDTLGFINANNVSMANRTLANVGCIPSTEICDSIDNDCDGLIDENVKQTFYRDFDADSYGNLTSTQQACAQPSGYVTTNTDCNDNNPNINPGKAEICSNGVDDNCNGLIDAADSACAACTLGQARNCPNQNGVCAGSQEICNAQGQWPGCNYSTIQWYQPVEASCDNKDNDCDGLTDENLKQTFYQDIDSDNYGNPLITQQACTQPSGYVTTNTDCNDNNPNINPGKAELCENGIDDDCDTNIDEGCTNCGNGNIEALEECDDGNQNEDDECANDCTLTFCGDNIQQLPNGEGIGGPFDDGYELCDDGANGNDTDQCFDDCMLTFCGDGVIQKPNGFEESIEECDGSNLGNLDCSMLGFNAGTLSCTDSCTLNTTGCFNVGDEDNDGISDLQDNCLSIANHDQKDIDHDGIGDVCDENIDGDAELNDADPCPNDPQDDIDQDEFCAEVDNCPSVYDESQLDSDNDNNGNVCDSCPYDADNDIDNDELCGDIDYISGGSSSINTNLGCLTFTLNNETDIENFNGLASIIIKKCNATHPIAEFNFNFGANSKLDLIKTNITVNEGSINSIIFYGVDLTSQNMTKTMYTNRLLGTDTLCIIDSEISSITVQGDCSNGIKLTCNGNSSGYSCEKIENNTMYKISGLKHSGIAEYSYSPSNNNGGNVGGGGGGGGTRDVPACTPNWECTEWSSCTSNGKSTRTCNNVNKCSGEKPSEERTCYYYVPKKEETNNIPVKVSSPSIKEVEKETQETGQNTAKTQEKEESAYSKGLSLITGNAIAAMASFTSFAENKPIIIPVVTLIVVSIILALVAYSEHKKSMKTKKSKKRRKR